MAKKITELVAEVAAPKWGDYCIDVCAAPGGKSLHLADKLEGSGFVEVPVLQFS